MGLDWIKLSCDLPRKRQVHTLCRLLKVRTADEMVGKLFRFWVYCEHESDAGRLPGVTAGDVDLLIGKKGFAEAMVAVGWLAFDPDGASVPGFDRFMGAASRARDQDAERKRRQRDRDAGGSRPPTRTPPDSDGGGVDAADGGGGGPNCETCRVEGGHWRRAAMATPGHDRDGGVTEPGPKRESESERKKEMKTHNTTPPYPPPGGESRGGCVPETKSNGPAAEPRQTPTPSEAVEGVYTPPTFDELRQAWNAVPDLPKVEYVPEGLRRLFRSRCLQPLFCERWRDALDAVRRSPRCVGATGWRADMRWFLKEDTLEDLLNGVYDPPRPGAGRERGRISRQEEIVAFLTAEMARQGTATSQPTVEASLCHS